MAIKRIGILASGGEVPGLNAVIKSATYRSSERTTSPRLRSRGMEGGDAKTAGNWAYLVQLNFEHFGCTENDMGGSASCLRGSVE